MVDTATGGVGRTSEEAFFAPVFLAPPALEISPKAVRLRESVERVEYREDIVGGEEWRVGLWFLFFRQRQHKSAKTEEKPPSYLFFQMNQLNKDISRRKIKPTISLWPHETRLTKQKIKTNSSLMVVLSSVLKNRKVTGPLPVRIFGFLDYPDTTGQVRCEERMMM